MAATAMTDTATTIKEHCDDSEEKDNTLTMSKTTLTYVEFYAGVGGWTMALQQAVRALAKDENVQVGERKSHSKRKRKVCGTVVPSVPRINNIQIRCVAALDHSDLCMQVYKHQSHLHDNDGGHQQRERSSLPPASFLQRRLEEVVTAQQLIEWNADIWMMSPPCQPHTRQHQNQKNDRKDPRSASFWHLCDLLASSRQLPDRYLPRLILLENVVGFEKSRSCDYWRRVLAQRQYHVAHFTGLQPTQVGLPNDRPRYYTVAVLLLGQGQPLYSLKNTATDTTASYCSQMLSEEDENENENDNSVEGSDLRKQNEDEAALLLMERLKRYVTHEQELLTQPPVAAEEEEEPPPSPLPSHAIHTCLKELGVAPLATATTDSCSNNNLTQIREFLDSNNNDDMLRVPASVLRRNASWCFDFVSPNCRRTACFTSGYGKFVKGTGSVLYQTDHSNQQEEKDAAAASSSMLFAERLSLSAAENRTFDREWAEGLDLEHNLRYFSGSELARLFGFPDSFTFPPSTTQKQQRKLMGNSINVRLASRLVELGLRLVLPGMLGLLSSSSKM